MTARVVSAAALALALAAAACASAPAESGAGAQVRRDPTQIEVAELEVPSVVSLTMWDAIVQLRPTWLRSRGTTSLSRGAGDELPGVVVDDVPQTGAAADLLRQLKAADTARAQLISASEATTRFGTGYPNGAIVITTRR